MQVSIIICTRNRADHLDQTLESLNTISVPAGIESTVVIVDNGSADRTPEVARKWSNGKIPARYVAEPRAGQSRARNAGMQQSTGEMVLFTDDDLRFPKNWLEGMCGPMVRNEADAVAGQVKLAPHLERQWMTMTHRSWLASSDRFTGKEASDMIGANMSFKRSLLRSVPAFDVELGPGASGYGDDTLFAKQILQAGGKIHLSQAEAVIHHFDASRLARNSWKKAAINFGKTEAYVKHHWEHETISRPRQRLNRSVAGYAVRRILRWRQCQGAEDMPEWELWSLAGIELYQQYLAESRRPRNYALRGLVKLQPAAA